MHDSSQLGSKVWNCEGETSTNFSMFPLELVSKELNHFGVIAGLFRQIEGHLCYFAPFEDFSL